MAQAVISMRLVVLCCAVLLQAKAAVTAAERDRKELEAQLQTVSQGIEAATAALEDVRRQIRAAEVSLDEPTAFICGARVLVYRRLSSSVCL